MTKMKDADDSPAALFRAFAADAAERESEAEAAERAKAAALSLERRSDPARLSTVFSTDHAYLAAVNKAAKGMFTVKAYPEMEGLTIGQLERRRGSAPVIPSALGLPPPLPTHQEMHRTRAQLADIPASWDWRNVSGVNYVAPVRDQGHCGSCYVFSSAAQLESRIRIRSKNAQKPILSVQDVVGCSTYAQGCDGGFPYLTAGKYAFDYGFVEEACSPYKGVDEQCRINQTDACNNRWHVDSYYCT